MSSVEIEKGMFRNKALLHHYPGKDTGFLWQLAGKEPHPLTGLDFLPADTALAVFSDMDLPVLWTVAQKEIAQADLPQAQQWLDKLPAQFEQKTQVKWDAFLNSLGGEFGLVITLDPSNNIPVPLGGGAVQIPSPGMLLAVKVNDDTIFNRIDTALKANPQVISVDKPGLKMRTMPVPVPFVGELRPSAASSGGYLFIATSDALIDEALAVKSGQRPGLKSTDEFKHLAQGLPDRGNQFCYMSQRFTETLIQVQQQAMSANSARPTRKWRNGCNPLCKPARLCLFRRHEHAGRLPDHWQRQPELRQHRASARRSRASARFPRLPFPTSSRPGPPRRKTPASTISARLTRPNNNGPWKKANRPPTFPPGTTSSRTFTKFPIVRPAALTPSMPSVINRLAAFRGTSCPETTERSHQRPLMGLRCKFRPMDCRANSPLATRRRFN